MKNCVITIPIYKDKLDEKEISSLIQCVVVLNKFKISFFCSESLDKTYYEEIISQYTSNYNFEYFGNNYFRNIQGYNNLLLSREFYYRYKNFKYVLIYQLDAWVFKDELDYWCKQGYDYIGAPWYEGYNDANDQSPFVGVGNGGFSLRNVHSHLKVLNSFSYLYRPKELFKKYLSPPIKLYNLFNFILNLSIKNNSYYLFNSFPENEDYFWGSFATRNFAWFTVPEENIAAKFATEKKASIFYSKNGLPFGCHGFNKYEVTFWKNHIIIENDRNIS